MKQSDGYILVIGQPLRDQHVADSIAQSLSCPAVVTASPDQAVAKARAARPYLVILSGDDCQTWSVQVARQIRQSVQPEGVVIVALTASSELSWLHKEANTDIDGFFVEPLNGTVLTSLNDSAIAQHRCRQLTAPLYLT